MYKLLRIPRFLNERDSSQFRVLPYLVEEFFWVFAPSPNPSQSKAEDLHVVNIRLSVVTVVKTYFTQEKIQY